MTAWRDLTDLNPRAIGEIAEASAGITADWLTERTPWDPPQCRAWLEAMVAEGLAVPAREPVLWAPAYDLTQRGSDLIWRQLHLLEDR